METPLKHLITRGAGILLALVLALGLSQTKSARAQQSGGYYSPIVNKTIGVPRWQPVGEQASQHGWLADSLQRLSTEDLGGIGEVNILSFEEFSSRMQDAGLSDINPNEADNARKIKKQTGVELLLIGTYQIQEGRIQLSAAFYNPETEETLAATNRLGSLGKIKSLQTDVIKNLLLKVDVTLGTTERNWLNRRKELEAPDIEFEEVTPRPELFRENKPPAWVPGEETTQKAYRKGMFVGFHYPGASIGFRTSNRATLEFRGSANADVTVVGGRLNYDLYRFGSSSLFMGVQGSHVDFVGDVSEGTGLLGGGFMGVQQYFTGNFSFRADFGSYLMSLEDDATGVSHSGLGFAVNTGVALHFL